MGVHVLIDVLPLMPHELIPSHTLYPGTIQERVKGVAAVMRGMLRPDAAGLEGSAEAFPALDEGHMNHDPVCKNGYKNTPVQTGALMV